MCEYHNRLCYNIEHVYCHIFEKMFANAKGCATMFSNTNRERSATGGGSRSFFTLGETHNAHRQNGMLNMLLKTNMLLNVVIWTCSCEW